MDDMEDLQAQIDALRLIVFALLKAGDVRALAIDAARRLEWWEDSHIGLAVTDSFLERTREQKLAAQTMLGQMLRHHEAANTEQTPPPSAP